MREYTVVFARSARKELQALDPPVAARILKRIEALTLEPRPSGCKKLEGTDNLWRIRIGDWRVVYAVDDTRSLVEVFSDPSPPRSVSLAWPLTIVGGVRERSVVTRRGRGETVCARGAWRGLLGGPSTSPLGAMTVGAFVSTVIGATLLVAFVPAWVAHSRRTLFISDFALVAVPALLLYGSGLLLNPELRIGFGLFVYPYLMLVACIAVLYARVLLLDHWHNNPRTNSLACFVVASVLSVAAGAFVPPFYE